MVGRVLQKNFVPVGLAVFLVLDAVCALLAAEAADEKLLDAVRKEIAAKADVFAVKDQVDALLAKLSILESQSNLEAGLDRARSIEDPSYASLALGGIAAVELASDRNASAALFREALERSMAITHWTDDHATSLGLLFGLLPSYPRKEAYDLLAASEEALDTWESDDHQKSAALLALSKATAAVAPEKARELLLDVALTSNHYWDSIEYLGAFMARQSLEETLKLAEECYEAKKNWPNEQYFLRAVLIELARTDCRRAFEGIKKMRDLDREIAAVKLAEALLAVERQKEACEVVDYIRSLESEFNWTQQSLERLQVRFEADRKPPSPANVVRPELIDGFLRDPNATAWRALPWITRIIFRDKEQVREFMAKALPLTESTQDLPDRYHGSQHSMAFGLMTICSAMLGDTDRALELSDRIETPALHAGYLLDAYEQVHPMPAVVSDWPVRFWRRVEVSIQDAP